MLKRMAIFASSTLVLSLAALAGLGLPSGQAAQSAESPNEVIQRGRAILRMTGVAHPRSGTISDVRRSTSGRLWHPSPVAQAASAASSFHCVYRSTRRLTPYRVLSLFAEGRSWTMDWILHPYSASFARRLAGGAYTLQLQLCVAGGGHTASEYHQTFQGASTVLFRASPRKLAHRWGSGRQTDNSITTTLGFQLGRKHLATVGAATDVTFKDEFTFSGSTGSDGWYRYYPSGWTYANANRVNGYYRSGTRWIWNGTSNTEGNTVQGLYEVKMANSANLAWGLAIEMRANCAKWGQIYGRHCSAFN